MTPLQLTPKQLAVYRFIAQEIREKQVAPSLEEIARAFGLSSVATVHKHVMTLQTKGYLRRASYASRSIVLLTQDSTCPTCGQAVKLPDAPPTSAAGQSRSEWESSEDPR